MVLKDLDIAMSCNGIQQGAFHFGTGGVLGVQHAALGMAAFLGQIEFALPVAIRHFAFSEVCAEIDQLLNARRAFSHDGAHHVFPA